MQNCRPPLLLEVAQNFDRSVSQANVSILKKYFISIILYKFNFDSFDVNLTNNLLQPPLEL